MLSNHGLFLVLTLIGVWLVSLTITWLINRKDLKRSYGVAPFNWRIYGYMYTYVPYLKKLQAQRNNDSVQS